MDDTRQSSCQNVLATSADFSYLEHEMSARLWMPEFELGYRDRSMNASPLPTAFVLAAGRWQIFTVAHYHEQHCIRKRSLKAANVPSISRLISRLTLPPKNGRTRWKSTADVQPCEGIRP